MLLKSVKRNPLVRRAARAIGLLPEKAGNHDHYHGNVAAGYLEKRLQQKSWHAEQAVVQELLAKLPRGIDVLDVPVGTGRFVAMFLERGMTVTGLDISQDMLDEARRALGDDYDRCTMLRGGAENMPFPDDSFGLVVCFRFFGLIPMSLSQRVLGEIRRVAKPGANVILRVPVRREGAPRLPAPLEEEAVGGRLYEGEVVEMFTRHGLAVVEKHSVDEREHVSYLVYLLQRQPG